MAEDHTLIGPVLRRDLARRLLGRTMALVAATAGAFALGACLGGNVAVQWGWLFSIGAIVCLFGLNAAVKRSEQAAVPLLLVCGALTGLTVAPTNVNYMTADPQAVWLAGGGS